MRDDFRQEPTEYSRTSRSVLAAVLEHGPVSRAGISRLTGLSKPTASEAIKSLEEAGLVRECGRTRGAIGRTAVTYEVCNDNAFLIACDLGASKIHIALADLSASIHAELVAPTERGDLARLDAQLRAMVADLVTKAGIDHARVMLAVIGTPGVVDRSTGSVALVPNIPAFHGVDLPTQMRAAFGCPVVIENDVNLGVLGEHAAGSGARADNLVFIALGTGIGMGLMVDGHLVRGARGAAGEIAYLPIGGDPFEASSIETGALETMVGAAGIVAAYECAGGTPGLSVRGIFDKMTAGDARAEQVIRSIGRNTALGIVAIAAVVDPDLIVLGGSIGMRDELIVHIRRELASLMSRPPVVEVSGLGNRASLEGALALGVRQLQFNVLGLERPLASAMQRPAMIRVTSEAAE